MNDARQPSFAANSGSTAGSFSPTYRAVRAGQYELAALRLLYGFLETLQQTAPDAREELLHLMTERRR